MGEGAPERGEKRRGGGGKGKGRMGKGGVGREGEGLSSRMKIMAMALGGLLRLVQRVKDWAGPQPAQAPPRYTNRRIAV